MTVVPRPSAILAVRRCLCFVPAAAVVLSLLAPHAHATPPEVPAGAVEVPEVAPEGAPGTSPAVAPAPPPRRIRPMFAEMLAALESEGVALAELRARPVDPADHDAQLARQREIERVKVETERSLLRIQASWARKEGRLEVARAIEASLEEMARPQPVRAAVRPPAGILPPSAATATPGR